jgi:hypothetical protein
MGVRRGGAAWRAGLACALLAFAGAAAFGRCASASATTATATAPDSLARPVVVVLGDTLSLGALRRMHSWLAEGPGGGTSADDPEARQLLMHTMEPLLRRYGEQHRLAPSNSEVTAATREIVSLASGADSSAGDGTPSAAAPDTANPVLRAVVGQFVGRFKVNRALYHEHGGRVLGMQLGPEPWGAYAALLRAARDAGDVVFPDPAWERRLFAYLEKGERLRELGGPEATAAIERPWWRGR